MTSIMYRALLIAAGLATGAAAEEPPLRHAWVREGLPPVLASQVGELPPGKGCVATVAPGAAPAWHELELPREASRLAGPLPTRSGTAVSGQVDTHDLHTYVPVVALAPREGTLPPPCWQALSALGWDRWQVGRGGAVTVGPLPPGRWTVRLEAPYHTPQEFPVEAAASLPRLQLPAVRLAPLGRVVLDLRLEATEDLSLVVEEITQQPASPPRVREVARQPVSPEAPPELELPPGRYRLQLRDAQPLPLWTENVTVAVGENLLTAQPTAIEVEGRVLAGRRGVAGTRLELVAGLELPVSVTADHEGAFALRLPKPERYAVELHLPDGRWQLVFLDVKGAAPGERVRRDLEVARAWLRGRVVGRDGRPLGGAEVVFTFRRTMPREQSMGQLTADAQGAFAVALQERASLTLEVTHRGFLPATLTFAGDPPEEVTVTLEPGLEVEGLVTDASGRPVAAAQVAVPGEAFGALRAATRTQGDGRFQLTVPPGSTVVAWGAGAGMAWTPAREQVLLVLPPVREPSVLTVLGPAKVPLAREKLAALTAEGVTLPYVALSAAQQLFGARAVTDGEGRVGLVALPDGSYTLLCQVQEQVLAAPVVLPLRGEVVFATPRGER